MPLGFEGQFQPLLSCVQSFTADPRADRANKGKVEALLEKEDRADSL